MATNTSTITLQGTSFDIYGSFQADDAGPPITLSATNYFKGSLNSAAWDAASFDNRQKALVAATRIFEKQNWVGTITDPTTPQPLLWPRTGVVDCDGQAVDPTCVPAGIVEGMYELAQILLSEQQDTSSTDTIENSPNAGDNLKRTRTKNKVDVLETESEKEYFRPTGGLATNTQRFPTVVHELVRCFLAGNAITADSLSFVSGATGEQSPFATNDYGFTGEGLP